MATLSGGSSNFIRGSILVRRLANGHLLGHQQNNLAILFVDFTQKAAKLACSEIAHPCRNCPKHFHQTICTRLGSLGELPVLTSPAYTWLCTSPPGMPRPDASSHCGR